MSRRMVVIPTYNERENLAQITRSVLELAAGFEVVIVDDSSPDGTGEAAERLAREHDRVHVIHRARKEGVGPAYIEGFRYALDRGAETIAQMDADLSHDPADLMRLVEALEECDLAIGSRYRGGVRVLDWSVKRLLLSLAASWYVKRILGMPVDDPTGGFKCFRRQVLERLPLEAVRARGYSFQIETTYRAWRQGFRIREIPIVFQERRRGGSKISGGIIREALYVVLRIRLGAGRGSRRANREANRDRRAG